MKLFNARICKGAMAAVVMGLMSSSLAAQEIRIRYASPNPESDPTQQAVTWFANEVTERTGGRVTFEMFLGASLVQDQDVLTAVGEGLVDMAKIFTVSYPGELPLFNIGNMPFTNPSPYVMIRTMHDMYDMYPAFDEEMKRLNVKAVGIYATGGTGLISKSPIEKLEDLRGLKVRTRGVQAQAFTAIGANAVAVPWAEVYEALSKGVVDATTNYLVVVKSVRHNEVGSHYIAAGLGQAVQAEIVNRDFWDALPDDIKAIMVETMAEAEERYALKASELAVSETEFFNNASGAEHLTVTQLPAAERDRWIAASPDFIAQWAQENAAAGATPEMAAMFQELQAKYNEQAEAKNMLDMW